MIGAYLELGFDHILDPKGYDHILFVVALCAIYLIRDWKKILILVTAFTIGHSLTLALSSLKIVNVSASLVETLIPITIVLTCLFNIWKAQSFKEDNGPSSNEDILDNPIESTNVPIEKSVMANYGLALGFGMIHGLGFSNFFKAMLGRDDSIVMPLLSFNIGVELGQIIIVGLTLLISYLLVDMIKMKRKYYTVVLSGLIAVWAVYLMF